MDTIITEDELITALFSAQAINEAAAGALTTRKLANTVGRSVKWVRDRLRLLIDEGKVESVRIRTVDITGRRTTSPAYRLKVRDD
ncbi:MAG: hypothetical protein V3V80_02945 [Dehalococcoidia bacterium]